MAALVTTIGSTSVPTGENQEALNPVSRAGSNSLISGEIAEPLDGVSESETGSRMSGNLDGSFALPVKHQITKARLLRCKVVGLSIVGAGVVVFGWLEKYALAESVELYRAEHDEQCHLYLYPFGEDDVEYGFRDLGLKMVVGAEFANEAEISVEGVQTKSDSQATKMYAAIGWNASAASAGSYPLRDRQCSLLFETLAATKMQQIHALTELSSPEPLQFKACRTVPMGLNTTWLTPQYNIGMATLSADFSLLTWVVLRLLGIVREVLCLNYDESFAPCIKDEGGLPLCGGRRIRLKNVQHVVLRPFLLFSALPTLLLRPWTSIRLHPECAQLITQNGSPMLIIVGVAVGLGVALACLTNYLLDFWFMPEQTMQEYRTPRTRRTYGTNNRFKHKSLEIREDMLVWWRFHCKGLGRFEGLGREHRFSAQDLVMKFLCLIVVVYIVTTWVLTWPFIFPVDTRYLLELTWEGFAVSRWAHALQWCALLLLFVDVAVVVGKFLAQAPALAKADLQHADALVRASKEQMHTAVQSDGLALECACTELRCDKDIVAAAVFNNGLALQWASDALRGDKDVVMAAVRHRPFQGGGVAIQWASDDLRCDKPMIMAAVSHNGEALEWASEALRSDEDVVMAAIHERGQALEFASLQLRDDEKIVTIAVQKGSYAFEYASERLRANKAFVLDILKHVNKYGVEDILKHVSKDLLSDQDVVMMAEHLDALSVQRVIYARLHVYTPSSALSFND